MFVFLFVHISICLVASSKLKDLYKKFTGVEGQVGDSYLSNFDILNTIVKMLLIFTKFFTNTFMEIQAPLLPSQKSLYIGPLFQSCHLFFYCLFTFCVYLVMFSQFYSMSKSAINCMVKYAFWGMWFWGTVTDSRQTNTKHSKP